MVEGPLFLPRRYRPELETAAQALPALAGRPVRISFRKTLFTPKGEAVRGASAIRERRIVLEQALLDDQLELRRVLAHEVFHFAWVRFSNARRKSWEGRLGEEVFNGARGELGWSSEWRKKALSAADIESRSRRWREYVCESFCDTAGWLFSNGNSAETTLSIRWKTKRRTWFSNFLHSVERIAI